MMNEKKTIHITYGILLLHMPIMHVAYGAAMPEPHDMPTEDFNSDRVVRNMICDLNYNDYDVFIEREWTSNPDEREWCVTIHARSRRIKKKGEHLISVLWATLQEANKVLDEYFEEIEQKRKAALAKLTDDDKKALGVS